MSLFPYFFREMARPLRMLENQMRFTDEIIQSFAAPAFRIQKRPEFFKEDFVVENKGNNVEYKMNLKDFKPMEITVKTLNNNFVEVSAKHEGEDSNKGFISREMVRRFVLPKDHDIKKIESSLSKEGVLTITAPKILGAMEEEVVIPITHETSTIETEKESQNAEKTSS